MFLIRILFNRNSLLFFSFLLLLCQQACGSSSSNGPTTQNVSDPTIVPPTQKPYVINDIKYYPIPSSAGYEETGISSWYGRDFHGKLTSNGEQYDMYKPTAAHKLLPMNTMLLVKNLDNGREEVVRINDRGPFVRGRIVDLSYSTAKKLDILRKGTSRVKITALAQKNADGVIATPQVDYQKGTFYVQIGSFVNRDNAVRLQKKFNNAGHKTVIRKYSSPQTVYFRVQVFAGNFLPHARNAEKSLLKSGYEGAFIIAR